MRFGTVVALVLVLVVACVPQASTQGYLDPDFTVSALIKPSDYPGIWPDSVGAWIIYANYDINKNGKKEFFVMADPATSRTSSVNPFIYWFEATANDTYTLLWSTQIPGTNIGQYSWSNMTLGDLDNDAIPEILAVVPRSRTESSPPRLFVYEFDGTTFPADPSMTASLVSRDMMRYLTTSVSVADVDGDGQNELITTSRRDDFGGTNDAGRTLLISTLIGEVGPFSSLDTEFADSSSVLKGGYVFSNYVLDYDNNGKPDIWVPTWDMLSIAAYEATGPNAYTVKTDLNQVTNPSDVGEHNGVRFYDVDGDGSKEMYWAAMSGAGDPSAVYYMSSTANISTLTAADIYPVSPFVETEANGNAFAGADIGDVDKDGKMDFIVTAEWTYKDIYRLEYQSGPLSSDASYGWSKIYQDAGPDGSVDFENVAIGDDLDGDGNREILIANLLVASGSSEPAVIILESKGSTDVRDPSSLPAVYHLEQNYPNPFNPTTVVSFQLPVASEVRLSVYDLLGRDVATLVNAQKPAGYHSVRFDAVSLPTGAYYYKLQARPTDGGKAGGFTEMKKMMLVK